MNFLFHKEVALTKCIINSEVQGFDPPYKGKVREVYELNQKTLGILVTDRISAFDYIMRQAIPFKGQILNQLASFSFDQVKDIMPNHILDVPHPNVTIAKKCDPIPIEIVVRGYLTGHAWRVYKSGLRTLCGVSLPEGLKEHDKLPNPILTPATKATKGHDEDISEKEILEQGIVEEQLWNKIREKAFLLFERGTQIAATQGLILVDTKYEMGMYNGELTLIDEVHTTDSSRYFYLHGYEQRQQQGTGQKQLSKEFLREWLIAHHFQGLEDQILPDLPDEFRMDVFKRYSELFTKLTDKEFEPVLVDDISSQLKKLFKPYRN